jgi:phospholipase C
MRDAALLGTRLVLGSYLAVHGAQKLFGLASVNSVVALMLENRSFDHMLGFRSRRGLRGDQRSAVRQAQRPGVLRPARVRPGAHGRQDAQPAPAPVRAELISRQYPAGVSAPPQSA